MTWLSGCEAIGNLEWALDFDVAADWAAAEGVAEEEGGAGRRRPGVGVGVRVGVWARGCICGGGWRAMHRGWCRRGGANLGRPGSRADSHPGHPFIIGKWEPKVVHSPAINERDVNNLSDIPAVLP